MTMPDKNIEIPDFSLIVLIGSTELLDAETEFLKLLIGR
jgi:hypothetical protein